MNKEIIEDFAQAWLDLNPELIIKHLDRFLDMTRSGYLIGLITRVMWITLALNST